MGCLFTNSVSPSLSLSREVGEREESGINSNSRIDKKSESLCNPLSHHSAVQQGFLMPPRLMESTTASVGVPSRKNVSIVAVDSTCEGA